MFWTLSESKGLIETSQAQTSFSRSFRDVVNFLQMQTCYAYNALNTCDGWPVVAPLRAYSSAVVCTSHGGYSPFAYALFY